MDLSSHRGVAEYSRLGWKKGSCGRQVERRAERMHGDDRKSESFGLWMLHRIFQPLISF